MANNNPTFGLPSQTLPINDAKSGLLASIWYQFFVRIAQLSAEQPISTVTPGASPYTYTASTIGHLIVTNGSGLTIILARGSGSTTCQSGVFIPMAANDTVTVTYSVAPTIKFIPSARA